MWKPTVAHALVAWIVLANTLAGCIAQPPDPDGPSASLSSASLPSHGPAVTPQPTDGPTDIVVTPTDASPTADPITAASCALKAQPGPGDVAPTEGDLTDWSHIFGGRWRVCVGGARPFEREGTAWCTWNDSRDAVREVSGLPIRIDAATGEIEGGVSLDRGVVDLGLTAPVGGVGSWEGGPGGQEIRSHDQGRRGIARFDVAPVLDPENPVVVVPPNVVGLMRWVCLEPPAR